MKVLLLIPDIKGKGGVANYYRKLNIHHDCDVTYFHVNKAGSNGIVATLVLLVLKAFRLIFLLSTNRYSVAHINPSLNQKSFFRDALFISIVKLFQLKLIVFFRGWSDQYEAKVSTSSFHSRIFNSTYAKAEAFIVLGEIFKNKLKGLCRVTPEKIYLQATIADSYNLQLLDLEAKKESFKEHINFLFISRIVPHKGLINALDIFDSVSKKFPDRKMTFNIAGDGSALEASMDHAKTHNIQNVNFLGYVEKEEKGDLLLRSHILLFPTFYGEGLPNCILESMLYGLVIVSTTVAGIPDAVTQLQNGFLSDQKTSEPYTNWICNLILKDGRAEEISLANHTKAIKNYTAANARKNLIMIYNEVVSDVFQPDHSTVPSKTTVTT